MITDQDALQRSLPAAVLEWKSHRCKRLVKSTLAVQAAAIESACDVGFYIRVFLSELLHVEFRASRFDGHTLVAARPITDCRSFYDTLIKQAMSTTEKRVQISFAAMRENTLPPPVVTSVCDGRLPHTSWQMLLPSASSSCARS